VPSPRRAPFVALLTLLQRRFPGLDDPAQLIKEGAVLVNGLPVGNPRTRVRADAAIQIRRPRFLRGTIKLSHALTALGVRAAGLVALDLGAAAGGFTQALLEAGAARVYAVDVGSGQLRGWLRADPRVINLEWTNLARLDPRLIGEQVDLPTFELHSSQLADQPAQVAAAAMAAGRALADHGWRVLAQKPSPVLGAKGAVEVFVYAVSLQEW
jgi:predicted rRNA methylase YqxC with S4 and FtsJ domains